MVGGWLPEFQVVDLAPLRVVASWRLTLEELTVVVPVFSPFARW